MVARVPTALGQMLPAHGDRRGKARFPQDARILYRLTIIPVGIDKSGPRFDSPVANIFASDERTE